MSESWFAFAFCSDAVQSNADSIGRWATATDETLRDRRQVVDGGQDWHGGQYGAAQENVREYGGTAQGSRQVVICANCVFSSQDVNH